jgi:hypothetical protein
MRLSCATPEIRLGIERIENMAELRSNWTGYVAGALVEEVRALELNCPCDGQSAELDAESGIEVALCFQGWQTSLFRRLRRLADNPAIPVGTDRDRLAAERLVPLIKRAERIAVLDRYIGVNLHKELGLRQGAGATQETEWLLTLIGAHAQNAEVRVFTAFGRGPDARATQVEVQNAFRQLTAHLDLPGIRKLQLFIAPHREHPHDRHIRFDELGLTFSAGLDRLRSQTTSKTFRLYYCWTPDEVDTLRDEEDTVRIMVGKPVTLKPKPESRP